MARSLHESVDRATLRKLDRYYKFYPDGPDSVDAVEKTRQAIRDYRSITERHKRVVEASMPVKGPLRKTLRIASNLVGGLGKEAEQRLTEELESATKLASDQRNELGAASQRSIQEHPVVEVDDLNREDYERLLLSLRDQLGDHPSLPEFPMRTVTTLEWGWAAALAVLRNYYIAKKSDDKDKPGWNMSARLDAIERQIEGANVAVIGAANNMVADTFELGRALGFEDPLDD